MIAWCLHNLRSDDYSADYESVTFYDDASFVLFMMRAEIK